MHKRFNPKNKYCKCGYMFKFNKLIYIKLLLFGHVSMYCPNCKRKHDFKLIYYVVEDFNKQTNQLNDKIKSVYKNG